MYTTMVDATATRAYFADEVQLADLFGVWRNMGEQVPAPIVAVYAVRNGASPHSCPHPNNRAADVSPRFPSAAVSVLQALAVPR